MAQAADANLYFANYLQQQMTPSSQLRSRLLQFLETSTLYNPDMVMNSLKRIGLYSIESCVVLAKVSLRRTVSHPTRGTD